MKKGLPIAEIAEKMSKANLGIIPKRSNLFGNEALKVFSSNGEADSSQDQSPLGQNAFIFASLINMWALPYSWAFLLMLLGFGLSLLLRTRNFAWQ